MTATVLGQDKASALRINGTEGTQRNTQDLLPDFEPLGVGVKRDFVNRLPDYKSDIVDGLNAQTVAAVLFLFFACLAPAIGFGSVLGAATGGEMGVIEMVAGTSLSGMLYAMFAAQPVQLIGPQGPVVANIAALYGLAQAMKVPFLPFYAWTGLWASAFLALFALTSASNLVQHLTRWTDEIFSVLVSALFLAQAVMDVARTFVGVGSAGAAARALLTLLCCTITFGTAVTLKNLPKKRFFTTRIRKQLANFAPALGVVVGSLFARAARIHWGGADAALVLPALQLPTQLVTSTGRPWWLFASLADLPVSARLWAALPASLVAILVYLDQNISARLVNHPSFRQVKGKRKNVTDGMHGDMLVLSILTALSSLLGFPWMCGAPTRTAAHVRALSKVDDRTGKVVGAIENRLSNFAIHAAIGLCAVAAGPRRLLAQVPIPVLSGVFLYLGYTSLQGLQLWDRVISLFTEDGFRLNNKQIPRKTVTTFTVAQVACIVAMMKVTQSRFGVLSPLLLAVLPLARWGLVRSGLVSKKDAIVLDS